MTESRDINIKVPVLARVEGEGALHIEAGDGVIHTLQLQIYEPPRLFEKFLEGRHYSEVPDIVARICGICPVAYQMSAVQALEKLFGCTPHDWVQRMRRLMYCGEWIESHSLHIHLLAAPDFLGYDSAPAMARDYPLEVRRGLRLQATGNELIRLLGGRSVHPVGVRVGGFHHAPAPDDVRALHDRVSEAITDAADLVSWAAGLPLANEPQATTCVALRHESEYPMNSGALLTSDGLVFDNEDFEQYIEEQQVPYSTALHALLAGRPYLVGPLARLNLNSDRLPAAVAANLAGTAVTLPSQNMFHSIVARAVEIHLALVEAEQLLADYTTTAYPCTDVTPRAGNAAGCTEAPRGILWHRYTVSDDGLIQQARIVPPTSQNQARIEENLRTSLLSLGLQHDDETLRLHSEKIIRNYDPCISCATHFLEFTMKRT